VKYKYNFLMISAVVVFGLTGCVANKEPPVIMSEKSAVELRAMQSRKFETPDEKKVFRAIISVMLDLGYAITSMEPKAGTISGNKLAQIRLTASIAASDEKTTTVRANAVVKINPQRLAQPHQVDSPEFYQKRFFEPLSQALFLDAIYEGPKTSPQK
jgi:hypothetical protein